MNVINHKPNPIKFRNPFNENFT